MTGLFFGSFNPIHTGHLQIARYLLEHRYVDEILFVVSPQNPFKKEQDLLDVQKRIEIAAQAVADDSRIQVSDVEVALPKPSYTADTLDRLSVLYPEKDFAIIMGEDNLKNFPLWKGYETSLRNYSVFVYPRHASFTQNSNDPKIHLVNAPLFPVSSTEIRERIRRGEDISSFVPTVVHDLILNYYRKTC